MAASSRRSRGSLLVRARNFKFAAAVHFNVPTLQAPPPPTHHHLATGHDYARDDGRGSDARGQSYDPDDSYSGGYGYNSPEPRVSHGGYEQRLDNHPPQPHQTPPVRNGSRWDQPAPSSYGSYVANPLPPPPLPPPSQHRVRKSRWGSERVEPGGLPTAITGGVEGKDLESYAIQLRLDEIARALRTGLVVPPDGSRSPSPPPTYDGHGRRTNTREVRYRKKLEEERRRLVDRQMKNDPTFRPPTEYLIAKQSTSGRPTDKVYIPVKEFPEINFFGLLVGPRGNSLKKMERESGARIAIRGKGSVKEGKGRPGGVVHADENDELHCLITADTEDKVQRCVKLINSVIEVAASVPEGQNDHKRNQLRELAQLNGTLRDDENQICQNCGGIGHRKYGCPEERNWAAGITCRVCGGAGHMARDCTQGRGGASGGAPGAGTGVDVARAQQFDAEYASLMAELGESSAAPPIAASVGAAAPWSAPANGNAPSQPVDAQAHKIPPWRIASNWNPPQPIPRGSPMPTAGYAAYQRQSHGYSSYTSPFGQYGGGYTGEPVQTSYGPGGYQQQQRWGR